MLGRLDQPEIGRFPAVARRKSAQRAAVGQTVAAPAAQHVASALLADPKHRFAAVGMHDRDENGPFFRLSLSNRAGESVCHHQATDFHHAARFAAAQPVRLEDRYCQLPRLVSFIL